MSIRLKKILFGTVANALAVMFLMPRVGSVPAWLWALGLAAIWWGIAKVMDGCLEKAKG